MLGPAGCRETWGCWKKRSDQLKIFFIWETTAVKLSSTFVNRKLPVDKVTFAVRGSPVINDATLADAEKTGMTGLVKVIDNGSDAPGTIIE